ncbi:uncharacterized protein FTOL_09279 [Fusarium torulosum]|uniref:Mannose-binding lectin n=1 Tax=Fusarium torulosum TaxID=33205 RepID=A0AAE8SLE8_9HYPO|nr:uncharacterized protein FTOL_09279 [Fusarium torulosum]
MGKQSQTDFHGENTHHPFTLYPTDGTSRVKTIEVWAGWGSGDAEGYWVLKGIQLTWFNGDVDKVYNHPKDNDKYSSYTFEKEEHASWSIRAGSRIVRFDIDTSTGHHWDCGEDGGPLFQHVANGFLVGFEGSAGWEVDYLSFRYETLD